MPCVRDIHQAITYGSLWGVEIGYWTTDFIANILQSLWMVKWI